VLQITCVNRKANIKITAVGLLVLFTVNIVLGFFCSIGLDMGYNSTHHRQSGNVYSHHTHGHGNKGNDSHVPGTNNHGSGTHSDSHSSRNDCCQTGVLQLAQLDKVIPTDHLAHPVFLPLALPHTTYTSTLYTRTAVRNIKQFVRNDHPPIVSDVRIAIQSFQI
jgi:hypothetical protein